jgi:hypothetical protein
MSAFNLEMGFTNWTFNISGMLKFPKDGIGLTALFLIGLMVFFAFICLIQILYRRADLDVEDNGFHLRANFPVDTGTNGRAIPNILRLLPVNQTPIRPRRPLRKQQ